jgi:hypothetical protein
MGMNESKAFSQNLIDKTIQCFKEEDGLDLSPEQANEYLHSMAGLFLAFTEKRADPIASATGGTLPVDTNHGDLTLGVSNT